MHPHERNPSITGGQAAKLPTSTSGSTTDPGSCKRVGVKHGIERSVPSFLMVVVVVGGGCGGGGWVMLVGGRGYLENHAS